MKALVFEVNKIFHFQRADLAITDFTITSDREEAVDFTVPFMNLGMYALFKSNITKIPVQFLLYFFVY